MESSPPFFHAEGGFSIFEGALLMAAATAQEIADFLIHFSHEYGDPVSNLKLQKLLYYAQAWYLALNDHPLFDERIEAWVHGPTVPSIYGVFKQWSWHPIEVEATRPEFREEIVQHLNDVMDAYGELSAYQLEKLTHSEDPWKNARCGLAPDEPSNAVISHGDMRQYYRARLDVESH